MTFKWRHWMTLWAFSIIVCIGFTLWPPERFEIGLLLFALAWSAYLVGCICATIDSHYSEGEKK